MSSLGLETGKFDNDEKNWWMLFLFYFLIFNNNVVFVLLPHWPSQCFLQNYLRVTCDICVVKDNFELS